MGRSRRGTLDYITIGLIKTEVTLIQGPPNSTHLDEGTGEEDWSYDKVNVTFNRSGRVTGWSIFSGELRDANFRMVPGPNATSSSFFSVDSHKDDIVRLQGTPYRIDTEWGFEFKNERDFYGRNFKIRETWRFSGGTVEFSISPGRVTAWDNRDGSLKGQARHVHRESEWVGDDFFTVGSTKKDVQRIQGRPTQITKAPYGGEETWMYGSMTSLVRSEVTFYRGRVRGWSNYEEGLKVRLVPRPNVTSRPVISIFTHKDDVIRLQETPTSIFINPSGDRELWSFSSDGRIEFSLPYGRIINYENNDGSLKARGIRPQTRPGENRRSTAPTIRTQGCGSVLSFAALSTATAIAAVILSDYL